VAQTEFATVGEYIASFPADVRAVLENIRRAILGAVPGAGEEISYRMAAITLDGFPVLYFAGWKRHVSVYPAPAADAELERRLEPYRSAKSTLKFPLSEPVPYELIAEVARRHVEQRPGAGKRTTDRGWTARPRRSRRREP
jgi:uncharacterized protein YdhG (YjbR/CyaY superfamily)